MTETKKFNLITMIKGIFFSIIFTSLLILIITAACYWGNISEKILSLMLFLASSISVFLSSLFILKNIKHTGLLYGTLNGLGYFIIILAASICVSGKFVPSAQSITMLIGSVLSGALGGVIGVNKAV